VKIPSDAKAGAEGDPPEVLWPERPIPTPGETHSIPREDGSSQPLLAASPALISGPISQVKGS